MNTPEKNDTPTDSVQENTNSLLEQIIRTSHESQIPTAGQTV